MFFDPYCVYNSSALDLSRKIEPLMDWSARRNRPTPHSQLITKNVKQFSMPVIHMLVCGPLKCTETTQWKNQAG